MEARINYTSVDPAAYQAMLGLQKYLLHSGLDRQLVNLVVLRASQINGCAFCIDMHTKDLRAEGETEQRLYLLDAWHEAPFYTDRERAAFAWTEAVTKLPNGRVSDDIYQQARKHFSEKELVALTMALVAINGWNRLNIAFQTVAGAYAPPRRHASGSAQA